MASEVPNVVLRKLSAPEVEMRTPPPCRVSGGWVEPNGAHYCFDDTTRCGLSPEILEFPPDGFNDEVFLDTERAYRCNAHRQWVDAFGGGRTSDLLWVLGSTEYDG